MQELIKCPSCGAPNYAGSAICARCGKAMRPAEIIPPQPQPVYLSLPILRGRPWISLGLLVINIVVWIAMTIAGGSTNSQVLLGFGAKYGPAILEGEYWRLFTSMFLHIGIFHLVINGYALYVLGQEVERFFGRGRFLTLYLLAGVLSSTVSYLFDSAPAAGASGAIFGLVGALAAFYYRGRKLMGRLGKSRLNNLITVTLINIVIGITVPNIDNWAHMGGLVAGLLIGWVLAPQYEVVAPGPNGPAHVRDTNSIKKNGWVVPAALVATVLLTLLGNMREGNTANGFEQQGQQLYEQGDMTGAIDAFSMALSKDPSRWSSHIYRGEVYLRQGDRQAALADYETVIGSGARSVVLAAAYAGRGRVIMLQGDPTNALIDFNQSINLEPNDPYSHFLRGLVYYEIEQPGLARTDLETSLALGLGDESLKMAEEILEAIRGGESWQIGN